MKKNQVNLSNLERNNKFLLTVIAVQFVIIIFLIFFLIQVMNTETINFDIIEYRYASNAVNSILRI